MSIQLETPFLEGGIAFTNFFNGRLLSGEDLTREQQARRAVAQQLGHAVGDGVAYGLWVAGTDRRQLGERTDGHGAAGACAEPHGAAARVARSRWTSR